MKTYYYHICKNEKELRDFLQFLDQQKEGYFWSGHKKAYVEEIIQHIIVKLLNDPVLVVINQDKKHLLIAYGDVGLRYAKMNKYKPYPYKPNPYNF